MKLTNSLLLIAVLTLPLAALADGEACKRPGADKHFSDMDTDHDGTVDKAEFRVQADKHFDEMDADHDGTVSKEEMMAGKHRMMKEHKMKESKE